MTSRIVLVNDTSMINAHFGTQLVGQTFREQFSRLGLHLIGAVGLATDEHDRLFEEADLLVINGEGSIHHGRNTHLIELAGRFRCVLINCVWQDNPPSEHLAKMKLICTRESLSANAIQQSGISCEIVPDISYASMLARAFQKPSPTEDLGVTDNVKDRDSGFSPFVETPHHYLTEMCRYRRLCIGRFHAAIAASVLGIPFSTWPSNTHKIEGLMRDMGVEHLHASSKAEAVGLCPAELDERITNYAEQAPSRIASMFDRIAEIADAK